MAEIGRDHKMTAHFKKEKENVAFKLNAALDSAKEKKKAR
jgi:hypothetical protein